MLRLAHKSAEKAPWTQLDPSRLEDVMTLPGWFWLDVTGIDYAEVDRIGTLLGFDSIAIEDVLSETEYPKVDDYGDHIFVVMHGLDRTGETLRTRELEAFLNPRYLVTFHRDPVPAVDWAAERAATTPAASEGGPDRMLSRIADAMVGRYLPLVEALDEHLGTLEQLAVAGDPQVVGEIQGLLRDAIRLRRIIGPQRDVFRDLGREGLPGVSKRGRLHFSGVYDHYFRVVESLETQRILLTTALDTYRSTVAENMNDVMRVLTVFSAILLPLSLMAGLYGMNFANMPELSWQFGYLGLLGVMAATAIGLWVYFVRRGFIGGPRLSTIPRVVGKGLVGIMNIGTAPVRMVADLIPRGSEDDAPDSGADDAPAAE